MPFIQFGEIYYYYFESLGLKEIAQGIFTRKGGISPKPWDSLNLGGTVGDSRENVIENRRRMFSAVNRPVESIYDVWQVHSCTVICSDSPRPLDQPHVMADIILTDSPNVTLVMRFADCVPIFLFDPVCKVVGIVHAGWQGTTKHAASTAINVMVEKYHCTPSNILAGIGPSIGPDHYEIQSDVDEEIQRCCKEYYQEVVTHRGEQKYLNLWQANRIQLEKMGVSKIEISGLCTACNTTDWFSHRGEGGKTGRFGGLIGLRGGG